jgi:Rrf2 family nitric oxide-sensitive transcriptional repressor
MRLADYTDYTLRVLMYCAANPERLVTIAEIAERLQVSKNHLMKIVSELGRQGLVETTRGRGGGLRLLKAPAAIRVGDVVRGAETDFRLVECFDPASDTCTLTPSCKLRKVLRNALAAYFAELDAVTLADIARTARSATPQWRP